MQYKRKKEVRIISKDEFQEIQMEILKKSDSIQLSFHLLVLTGLRVSDITELKTSNLKQKTGFCQLKVVEMKTGKTNTKEIYDPYTIKLINKRLNRRLSHDYLICSTNDIQKGVTRFAINKLLMRLAKFIGIEHIHPHTLRRFYATKLYDLTNNLLDVQYELNHSNLQTTQIYLGIDEKRRSDNAKKLAKALCL